MPPSGYSGLFPGAWLAAATQGNAPALTLPVPA